ncbi:MAG TPA: hypothetical protein VNS22_12395 [Geminicoccus sp.]|uniref:hypothetical protein n=1 Tax=Geminicoccus sp. TaxID=2024832 RepID=UPI002B80BAAF|nr:hypothetical protein [Geminicoccus sp.]HWL69172.1 hypothetical protein [Geminicoccus sp.]
MQPEASAVPSLFHELRIIQRREKPSGSTVYEYRGAQISHSGSTVRLEMPGHPYDSGNAWAQLSHVQKLVDHWLDHQAVPAPYVWPPKG